MRFKGATSILLLGLMITNLPACSFKKDDNKNANNTVVTKGDEKSKTAFEALERNDLNSLEKFLDKMSTEKINAYSDQGQTLLEIAVRQSNLYVVEKLLEKGALPLKPSQKTMVTPLSIGEKLNASVFAAMKNAVEKVKSRIVTELTEKNYSEALKLLKYNYLSLNSLLKDQSVYLDILLSQEAVLNSSFSELLPELILGTTLNQVSYQRLLSLTLEDSSLFESSLKKGSEKFVLDSGFLANLFRKVSDQNLEKFLNVTLKVGAKISVPLSQLQQDFLQKIIESTPQGKVFDLNLLSRQLNLLAKHASDNIFCSSCIEFVFDSKSFQMQKGEIVKLLVVNSGDAPQGFLSSLLGRVNTADFNLILSSLSKEQRKQQSDVLSQKFSSEEYVLLKQYGFKFTGEQAKYHLINLFAQRHKNDPEATRLLNKIGTDFSLAKGSISKLEMETLFTNEFNYVRFQGPTVDDLFYILGSAKNTDVYGLITYDSSNENIIYYNPKYIFKDDDHISTRMFDNAAKISPSFTTSWFLTFKGEDISYHDLLWLSLVNTDKAKEYIISNFHHPIVNKLISLTNVRDISNTKTWDITDELKSSNHKVIEPDLKYREKYLRGLLASSSSILRNYLIKHLIVNTQDSSTLEEPFYGVLFVDYLKTITNTQTLESVFKDSFIPYLLKMNPKYKYIFDQHSSTYEEDIRNYKGFLQGEFYQDILCNDANRKTSYRPYCKDLDIKRESFKACKFDCTDEDRKEPIDRYQSLERMRERLEQSHKEDLRKADLVNAILARDKEVISSAISLKELPQTTASISQFLSEMEPLTKVPLKKIDTRSKIPKFPINSPSKGLNNFRK